MGENTQKFITKGFWVVIILFVIRCFINKPISLYDYFGFAGEAIGIAVILMGLYECIIWRYNPLEKIPKIMGEYSGFIEYSYNGTFDKKEATIKISQSLLSTNVKIATDEITSNTIASSIVLENSDYVLYYNYITNPKSKYSKDNPIQYGTCRLTIKNKTELQGTYWTTRQTIGDIYLKRIKAVK
jgi:hypothetical protein